MSALAAGGCSGGPGLHHLHRCPRGECPLRAIGTGRSRGGPFLGGCAVFRALNCWLETARPGAAPIPPVGKPPELPEPFHPLSLPSQPRSPQHRRRQSMQAAGRSACRMQVVRPSVRLALAWSSVLIPSSHHPHPPPCDVTIPKAPLQTPVAATIGLGRSSKPPCPSIVCRLASSARDQTPARNRSVKPGGGPHIRSSYRQAKLQ